MHDHILLKFEKKVILFFLRIIIQSHAASFFPHLNEKQSSLPVNGHPPTLCKQQSGEIFLSRKAKGLLVPDFGVKHLHSFSGRISSALRQFTS